MLQLARQPLLKLSKRLILMASLSYLCACQGYEVSPEFRRSLFPPNGKLSDDLDICSTLDFDGVTWSDSFNQEDRQALALALNVTGSYEGSAGWANLSNNFDGQGVSFGLLNQNLGTGSLQPMLLRFRKETPGSYQSVLPLALRSSMDGMLNRWAEARGLTANEIPLAFPFEKDQEREYASDLLLELSWDFLGVDKFYASGSLSPSDSINDASVRWAVENLYSDAEGKEFKPEWRTALKNIASHPDYVSLQIEASEYLHRRALNYQGRLGFYELRSYLMLFDIAVQNGSLRQTHFDQFSAWLQDNPTADQEEQMLELIEIRVASSIPRWQEDVRRRKRTIVLGVGHVHGRDRNLPEEFCYDPLKIYPEDHNLP